MKNPAPAYCAVIAALAIALVFGIRSYLSTEVIPIPDPASYDEFINYRININTATAEQLQIIPGVGPSLAEKIIAYREENGAFCEYTDLLNVNGIGKSKLAVMLEYIIIE